MTAESTVSAECQGSAPKLGRDEKRGMGETAGPGPEPGPEWALGVAGYALTREGGWADNFVKVIGRSGRQCQNTALKYRCGQTLSGAT